MKLDDVLIKEIEEACTIPYLRTLHLLVKTSKEITDDERTIYITLIEYKIRNYEVHDN